MKEQDLRSMLEQAREFEHTVDGIVFRCRLPTMKQARTIHGRHEGPGQFAAAMADIVYESVLSATGLTMRHFGIDSDDVVPASQAAAHSYLADRMEAADALATEVLRRVDERQKRIEAAVKN